MYTLIKIYSNRNVGIGGWVAKLVKLACLVKLAFTHHEALVVGGPTDRVLHVN